jgi:UbiD family decarboxylase
MQQVSRGKEKRSEAHSAAMPNQAFDLRSTLEWLRASGELIETDKEVDPDLQVTGLQKHMDGGCPVLCHTVKGKPNHRVITNLFGDMVIINRMFGWTDDAERVRKLAAALSHPI